VPRGTRSASVPLVNIIETVAIYAGGPLALYGVIASLTLIPSRAKRQSKYRPGQTWDYPDQWWAGDYPVVPTDPALVAAGSEGGARGTW
jgi:hypothetical protein